jgi:hypothetical protein
MKGGPNSMDKSTRRAVFVLYIVLFLLSTTSLSMIQLHINHSTTYSLYIEYQSHTVSSTGYDFDHSYSTIIIDTEVTADNYESVVSSLRVSIYPFWLDTSDWVDGETRTISGNLYSIYDEGGYWRAHRSWSDFESENLHYNKALGIFIEGHNDRMSLGTGGFSGSDTDIEIQQGNIQGFAARVTGNNLVGNILLLSGIFIEVLIIQWAYTRRKSPEK